MRIGYTFSISGDYSSDRITIVLEREEEAAKGDLTYITIKGISKQTVGDVSAQIRKSRQPDPYKHKGVRYANEVIRKKIGKRAVVQA